jgi:hypothetical protein
MRRSIVATILITFVAVACVAEVLGERPVASPQYGPPPGSRRGAASASDGHDFLVAWVDASRSRTYSYTRIYAARVTAAGQVLDPLGIRIPTLTASPNQINVVYLGNAYLICWNEGYASTNVTPPLVGVRISTEGQLLDSTPRVFADRALLKAGGVASNGNRAVIACNGTGGSLMTIVLDRDANIVDGPRTLTNPFGASNETALTSSNGHGFLVVRTFGTANFAIATALDANGTPLSTLQAVTVPSGTIFGLASDGDSYVAVVAGAGQISANHFGPGGEVLESSIFPLLQVFPALYYPTQQVFPGLVFTGDSYLFMDGDPSQKTLGLRRLTRTGQPTGVYSPIVKAATLSDSFWYAATLAFNGSSAFAGWVEPASHNESFNGSLIEVPSLAASAPAVIARAANTQITPGIASSGTNTAIVWNEDDGVYAGRLTLDGRPLDGRGIKVGGVNVAEPRIAFDGVNYIIGWNERDPANQYKSTIKMARFAPGNGMLLDPDGIAVTQKGYGSPALAPAPNGTLLAWSEGGYIVATILGRDLSRGLPVTVNPSEGGGNFSAAWNGSGWLLTWETSVLSLSSYLCTPACYDILIHAARLSPQLALLDASPIKVSESRADSRPFVASDGDGFLVVWSRSSYDYFGVDGGYAYGVYAQRISRDGSLLGPVNGVRIGAGQARSVVWDGLQYDVAFTARHYPAYYDRSLGSNTATLNVTHVAGHGAIESLTPQTVMTDRSDADASLLVTGTGNITVAYTRIGTEPEYGDVERVFVTVPRAPRGRASR